MELEARSPTERLHLAGADRPEIAAVAWKRPSGWDWPDWLPVERVPASLPMHKDRLHWCMKAIGWSLEELARRIHTHESSVRQMGRGRREIPDDLAYWIEVKTNQILSSPMLPDNWRAKPGRGASGGAP
jgi:hypothetical protein